MPHLLACIDGSVYSNSIADHTAWAAKRLGANVELMMVLGRREAKSEDRSGRIIAGARRQLLEELASVDAERSKLLQQQGRLDLHDASERIGQAGVSEVSTALRYGDLLEEVDERQATADLIVIGKRGEAADFATLHLGSNLERIVRATDKPVLVASRSFKPIKKFLIAYDARMSAKKAVDAVSRSPLFTGLEGEIIMASEPTSKTENQMEQAASQLRGGGLTVATHIVAGPAEQVIADRVAKGDIDLLIMGTFGRSRLRALVIGSTTSEMIRACQIPIMVYR